MSDRKSNEKSRILALAIGFLILFVATFSLGVLVGKGLIQRSLSTTQLEDTFPVPETATERAEVIEDTEPQVNDASTEEIAELEKEAQVPRQELLVKEDPVTETPAPIEPTPKPKEVVSETEPTDKPASVVEKPVPTKEPERLTREAAIEEIAKNDQNKRKSRVKLPPVDPGGAYTVQIGSFTDRKAADSIMNSMKNKGYPAYINSMTASDNKKWYRVRIGTFNNSEAATKYGENLKILEPDVKIVFITQNN